jgi:hypothetical protein
MLLEWVRYEDVIVLGIAVIRTGAREIVNPIVYVVTPAGARRGIGAGRG